MLSLRLACLLCVLPGAVAAQKGPVRLQLTPQNPAIGAGSPNIQLTAGEIFFTAVGKQAAGLALTATWSSSNTAVATVIASGLVTGQSSGSATITAVSGPFQNSITVTVACSHSNGLGQTYDDCADALGAPGNAGSYNQTMASRAATAWGAGTISAVSCGVSNAVEDKFAGMCAVWAYSGPLAGHVQLAVTCNCPISTSVTWN